MKSEQEIVWKGTMKERFSEKWNGAAYQPAFRSLSNYDASRGIPSLWRWRIIACL
jgi:hypothetical protein